MSTQIGILNDIDLIPVNRDIYICIYIYVYTHFIACKSKTLQFLHDFRATNGHHWCVPEKRVMKQFPKMEKLDGRTEMLMDADSFVPCSKLHGPSSLAINPNVKDKAI